jgi:O-methyltransferase involved in polyketide biosynthesis
MHRGYWARLYLFKHILDKFLSEGMTYNDSANNLELQVISIGCGLDTSYFNERSNEKQNLNYTYIEVDLPSVCEKKVNNM